jgi:hypothetical protein
MPDRLLRYRINPEGVTQKAMKEKRAALARRRVWERHAPAFTGLPQPVAMQLHNRSCAFSLPLFWRMSRHFRWLDGMEPLKRMRHPSFLDAMEKFIARKDLASRVWVKACRSARPAPADAPPTP